MRPTLLILLFSAVLGGAACAQAPLPAPAAAATSGKKVDPATAGSLEGKVSFKGTPPAPDMLRISADPVCMQALGSNSKSDSLLISSDGGIQNAFVYIKDSMTEYAFDTPAAPISLDQKGCHYTPRIFGVRVGQGVDIVNSDATLHNVHALPMVNTEFNKGQPVQGSHMTQVFTAPEVMVRFKCDVHSWMTAYGGVMAHPFFAVTDANGAFSIKGLPPGDYELAVWHEKLGTSSLPVKIGTSQTQTANFTLAAAK